MGDWTLETLVRPDSMTEKLLTATMNNATAVRIIRSIDISFTAKMMFNMYNKIENAKQNTKTTKNLILDIYWIYLYEENNVNLN